jgi:hypothetical protein
MNAKKIPRQTIVEIEGLGDKKEVRLAIDRHKNRIKPKPPKRLNGIWAELSEIRRKTSKGINLFSISPENVMPHNEDFYSW